MKKALKILVIILALAFIGIQFVRPERSNPPIDETKTVEARLDVPADVDAVLNRSCNDCHSNKTNWIWYSNIAPVSWFLTHHVEEGRRELNFSEIGKYSPNKIDRKLEEVCDQVEKGEMPLWNYTIIHWSARLTDADKKLLCDWTVRERDKIQAANNSNTSK